MPLRAVLAHECQHYYPLRDSSPQSSEKRSNALSIRPRGLMMRVTTPDSLERELQHPGSQDHVDAQRAQWCGCGLPACSPGHVQQRPPPPRMHAPHHPRTPVPSPSAWMLDACLCIVVVLLCLRGVRTRRHSAYSSGALVPAWVCMGRHSEYMPALFCVLYISNCA